MNTKLSPDSLQQIILTLPEKTTSPHWTNEFMEIFKRLPPKYQAYIILVGLVGTFAWSTYALHKGGTVVINEREWSVTIKATLAGLSES